MKKESFSVKKIEWKSFGSYWSAVPVPVPVPVFWSAVRCWQPTARGAELGILRANQKHNFPIQVPLKKLFLDTLKKGPDRKVWNAVP